MEKNLDYNRAIEIAENIYWIGIYLENDSFQCHPYLIENGNESVLIDPGSMLEFDAVVRKIGEVTDIKNIKYIVLHHQDPDLAAAVPEIEKLIDRDDLQIITHSRMTVLIKHYLLTSDYYEIDKNDFQLKTNNGLELEFLTTPYCHSPGAFVSYDPSRKILFSGDIFGGLEESWEFYADEDYFKEAELFHKEYMPSRDIFNYALNKIEKLDIDLIAPQHGSIIEKRYIAKLIADMKKLDCGLYIESGYNEKLLDTIEKLEKKEQELIEFSRTLELRVKEEVEKNREKDKQMLHQSRLAQMGEMISMIAHQWRQPLNAISATSANLSIKAQLNKINKDLVIKETKNIDSYSQHLSRTIDDFRNFFKSNKILEEVTFCGLIQSVLRIINVSLDSKHINLITTLKCKDKFRTYPNEVKQVILNLMKNAEDILTDKDIDDPFIKLSTYQEDGKHILEVGDNGGGIPLEIIDRIFDPYFTTKDNKEGTGLGLYMSKIIIEEHCKGKLTVRNTKDGAIFRICL